MNGLVIDIVEVNDDICLDSENNHNEELGAKHLEDITYWPSQMWKETKEDGSIRKNFATIGGKYDDEKDAFIDKKIHSAWVLDESTCRYKAPVTPPSTNLDRALVATGIKSTTGMYLSSRLRKLST